MLPSALRAVALSITGVLALMFFLQSKLVYFPDGQIIATPADRGLPYEEVTFEADDGVRLSAWFVPSGAGRGVVLFSHGNGGNISYNLPFVEILHRVGLSIFIYDYRGYGRSRGKPSEEGTYSDAGGAWRYLTESRKVPAGQILLYGQSLGGPVAAKLARGTPPAALILDSTFTNFVDIAGHHYPFLPVRWLARFEYNALEHVRNVRCPVLVIHSTDDEIVPFSQGLALYEAAPEPKAFIKLRGGHNDALILSAGAYREGIDGFLKRIGR
nr:alpha/beta hydrolase [Syntrophobacterales bacterium]